MNVSAAAERRRAAVYGIPPGGFVAMLEYQLYRCPVCGRQFGDGVRPVVDHDHRPGGRVRGLLCASCNHRVVGRHTDPARLRSAAAYLEAPPAYGFGWPACPPRRRRPRRKAVGQAYGAHVMGRSR